MALVPLRLLLDHAAENGYGIPAFNVNNLEQVQAIMEAAYETDSPVILQASRGARNYAGEIFLSGAGSVTFLYGYKQVRTSDCGNFRTDRSYLHSDISNSSL